MSRRRGDLPSSLGSELDAELVRLGGTQAAPLAGLIAAWPSRAGPAIAANAWPARPTRSGVVVVHVSSSAWAFELTQLEEAIRDRLGEVAPPGLKFVVGPLPSSGSPDVGARQPTQVSAEDVVAAELLAAEIESVDLRERVKRAASLSLASSRAARPDRSV